MVAQITPHSIKRSPGDEQIILDPANQTISIVGRTFTCRVPLAAVQLEKYKLTGGGVLSVNSGEIHLNLNLSIDEYSQCDHYFQTMNRSFIEVLSC